MSREQLLHEAIENGCLVECKRLLLNGNDIVNKEFNKKYPLCWACENNNYDIVELLIKVLLNHKIYRVLNKKFQK